MVKIKNSDAFQPKPRASARGQASPSTLGGGRGLRVTLKTPPHQSREFHRDEHFYDEMARSVHGSGWCRAAIIVWLSAAAIVIGTVIIWIFFKPIQGTSQGNGWHFGAITIPTVVLHTTKSTPDAPEYRIHLTDQDLATAVSTITIPNTHDLALTAHHDYLQITGTSTAPIKAPLNLQFVPQVHDGQITIEVHELTIAGVRATPLATGAVRQSIADALKSLISAQIHGTITRIDLEDGAMSIYWKPQSK